jgi:hypothetical protein
MSQNLYKLVVDECTRTGGPTDRCCTIYQKARPRGAQITQREYWMAVQEGMNRYRARRRAPEKTHGQ